MAIRKTISRDILVAAANRAISAAPTADERETIATMLTSILMGSNAYAGFSYPASELDMATGQLLPDYDDTRRVYA
jgi:hypothetical protein